MADYARRKAIYEALHPEVKAGTAGAIASNKAQGKGNATDNLAVASYAIDAAKTTGESERTVRRKTRIGEALAPISCTAQI